MRFRRSLVNDPNAVAWEALDERAKLVTGRVVLHAGVSETEIMSWAEVVIDCRADPLAERVAREYVRRSDGLVALDDEEDERGHDDGEQGSRTVLIDPKHLRLIEPAAR